jgi:hypothetical protein
LIRWDPRIDGYNSATGQYGADATLVIDYHLLPGTYGEYFEMVGMKVGTSKEEATSVNDALEFAVSGHRAVPLTKQALVLMDEMRLNGRKLVFSEDPKTPSQAYMAE